LLVEPPALNGSLAIGCVCHGRKARERNEKFATAEISAPGPGNEAAKMGRFAINKKEIHPTEAIMGCNWCFCNGITMGYHLVIKMAGNSPFSSIFFPSYKPPFPLPRLITGGYSPNKLGFE